MAASYDYHFGGGGALSAYDTTVYFESPYEYEGADGTNDRNTEVVGSGETEATHSFLDYHFGGATPVQTYAQSYPFDSPLAFDGSDSAEDRYTDLAGAEETEQPHPVFDLHFSTTTGVQTIATSYVYDSDLWYSGETPSNDLAEAVSAADAELVSIFFTETDSGSGGDAATQVVSFTVAETVAGLDAERSTDRIYTQSESATAEDAEGMRFSLAETATAADAETVAKTYDVGELAVGREAWAFRATLPVHSDTGGGIETERIKIRSAEVGTTTATQAMGAVASSSDVGSMLDVLVARGFTATDAALGWDLAGPVLQRYVDSDAGTAVSAEGSVALRSTGETGAAVEAGLLVALRTAVELAGAVDRHVFLFADLVGSAWGAEFGSAAEVASLRVEAEDIYNPPQGFFQGDAASSTDFQALRAQFRLGERPVAVEAFAWPVAAVSSLDDALTTDVALRRTTVLASADYTTGAGEAEAVASRVRSADVFSTAEAALFPLVAVVAPETGSLAEVSALAALAVEADLGSLLDGFSLRLSVWETAASSEQDWPPVVALTTSDQAVVIDRLVRFLIAALAFGEASLWEDIDAMVPMEPTGTVTGQAMEPVHTGSVMLAPAMEMVATEVDEFDPITNDPPLEVGTWSTLPPD